MTGAHMRRRPLLAAPFLAALALSDAAAPAWSVRPA